jgi:hypothetical protein
MTKPDIHLTSKQRRLLQFYWWFYRQLDLGERQPDTQSQRHFVQVCRGVLPARTEHERAYLRGRDLLKYARLSEDEILQQGFQLHPEQLKHVEDGESAPSTQQDDMKGASSSPAKPWAGKDPKSPPLKSPPPYRRPETGQEWYDDESFNKGIHPEHRRRRRRRRR